ncbi:MAG TPA: dienelactone hydrolase family protein, partial [Gemmatimonadaceae bacterium]
MAGRMISFPINGRDGSGYLALPPMGSGPGLLVIQEYWGLVDHIKQLADRFAAEGFVALAPDMYHGKTTKSPDDAGKMLMALNIAEAGKDLRGAAKYLLGRDDVASRKVASLGFCMGGQLALFGACAHPDLIGA